MGLLTEFIGSARAESGPGASPYHAYDTFTRTASNSLGSTEAVDDIGRSIAQRAWTENIGDLDIASNRLVVGGYNASHIAIATIDVGVADFSHQMISRIVNAAGWAGICFRYVNATQYWMAVISDTNRFILYEVDTSATIRDEVNPTISDGVDYTIKAVCSGTSISVTLDGGNAVSFTSSKYQAATKVGMRHFHGSDTTGGQYDNLKVW